MSDLDTSAESTEPKAHARIVYLGPVSPHWEVYGDWGDRQTLDEFRARVLARLVLLPREDPQFRRNRERIVRDAEREMISIEWDLGVVMQQSNAPKAETEASSASDESASEEDAPAEDASPSEDQTPDEPSEPSTPSSDA
ncbi:hypothetical protein [Ilumatobacter nonamiensis]|uniref:hypothetical protein n=1 Tax=Ilumatobacter nonamiensis TaxID=467093 RepID=UPI00187D844E|nr:hypothetical protein [Ilumatobacter nonamiensis]